MTDICGTACKGEAEIANDCTASTGKGAVKPSDDSRASADMISY
jgi:hypothetical protein